MEREQLIILSAFAGKREVWGYTNELKHPGDHEDLDIWTLKGMLKYMFD